MATWAVEQRARGIGWRTLAREIGLSALTLQRWTSHRPAQVVALRRVELEESVPVERTVTLVAPNGMRVEGVTVRDAVAILRGLT